MLTSFISGVTPSLVGLGLPLATAAICYLLAPISVVAASDFCDA